MNNGRDNSRDDVDRDSRGATTSRFKRPTRGSDQDKRYGNDRGGRTQRASKRFSGSSGDFYGNNSMKEKMTNQTARSIQKTLCKGLLKDNNVHLYRKNDCFRTLKVAL
jgi:hypothetical protein